MRKMFYEGVLPTWEKGKQCVREGDLNLLKCVGCKVNFIYDDIEGCVEIIGIDEVTRYLIIKYLDREHKMSSDNFKKCQLGKLLGKRTSEFKIEIGQVFKDDKRDIVITDKEYRIKIRNNGSKRNQKWYKYTCNKCGWTEGWVEEGYLLRGAGCGCCCVSPQIVIVGINDIPTTAPWMVKYFQGGYEEAKLYTYGSGQNIHPMCPDCGRVRDKEIKIKSIYFNNSIGCSCGDGYSTPNKIMFNILEQLNIDFIPEYKPYWANPRSYDFYIPNLNIIIEMDGGLGHGKRDNNMNGQSKEESKAIDDHKDMKARENGIDVIRIDCDYKNEDKFNFIKQNVLDSKLNKIFDFSQINWINVIEFSHSSLIKQACELWTYGTNSIIEISEIMKKDVTTINNYLKQGKNIWDWMNYDFYKENLNFCNTPIEVFRDGISLGIFKGINAILKESKEKFRKTLGKKYVSDVCKGIRDEYNGFIFEYRTKEEYKEYLNKIK